MRHEDSCSANGFAMHWVCVVGPTEFISTPKPSLKMFLKCIGAIPARAGEPLACALRPAPVRAYPRSRGGTCDTRAPPPRPEGLSPLARGNLLVSFVLAARIGPIPARAGEPGAARRGPNTSWAYPRSRGGTVKGFISSSKDRGLSPLARGNPTRIDRNLFSSGPIPARAGEPSCLCHY